MAKTFKLKPELYSDVVVSDSQKQLIVVNDIHAGSSIEMLDADRLYDWFITLDMERYEVFSNGDNWDLAGCHKDMVPRLREKIELLIRSYYQPQDYYAKIHQSLVNHERPLAKGSPYAVSSVAHKRGFVVSWRGLRILITHGVWEKWGEERTLKYISKKHGASWFKRKFIIPLIECGEEHLGVNKVTDFMRDNCKTLADHFDLDYIVCGHIHPKDIVREKINHKCELLVMPRGMWLFDGFNNEQIKGLYDGDNDPFEGIEGAVSDEKN